MDPSRTIRERALAAMISAAAEPAFMALPDHRETFRFCVLRMEPASFIPVLVLLQIVVRIAASWSHSSRNAVNLPGATTPASVSDSSQ
jgi:hypothetical protein